MLELLSAWLLWAPPVDVQRPHDQPPVLALSWATAGASACPTRAQLLERIDAQGVGGPIGDWVPERHEQAALAVEVEVLLEGDRWRARLSLIDADGRSERSFTAASCAALADATALIVAVTLDPVAVASTHASVRSSSERAPEPEPAAKPEPAVEPKPAIEADPPSEREPASDVAIASSSADADPEPNWPEDLRVGFSLHGGAGWGPVATVAGQFGGRVALLGPRWRAELGGRWATPRRLESNGAAGIFDAWVIEVRGCFVPTARKLEFPLCPGIELGSVRGRGDAPTSDPDEASFLWVAPGLSQGLSWVPVERFAIGLELGLLVPLTRGDFVVGESTIASLPLVGGRALATLEVRLP